MRNFKLVSLFTSLVILPVCFGQMAFDAFLYEAPQSVLVDYRPIEFTIKNTTDHEIEIITLEVHFGHAEDLHVFDSIEIRCNSCTH